jgi:hypothetical protein
VGGISLRYRRPQADVPQPKERLWLLSPRTRIAFHSGQSWPYSRCPYEAKVMKTFDSIVPNVLTVNAAQSHPNRRPSGRITTET